MSGSEVSPLLVLCELLLLLLPLLLPLLFSLLLLLSLVLLQAAGVLGQAVGGLLSPLQQGLGRVGGLLAGEQGARVEPQEQGAREGPQVVEAAVETHEDFSST